MAATPNSALFRPAIMEPSMPFDFQQFANFRLARGSHKQPNKGGNICVNEAAVIAAGFQYREIRDVISRIVNGHPQTRLDDLLPWHYPATPQLQSGA